MSPQEKKFWVDSLHPSSSQLGLLIKHLKSSCDQFDQAPENVAAINLVEINFDNGENPSMLLLLEHNVQSTQIQNTYKLLMGAEA